MSPSIDSPSRWDRRDTWVLLALLLAAAIPRFWSLGSLGLNQFDEGGYALSSLAIHDGVPFVEYYARQHWLSPPVFFLTSGILMRVLGTSSDLVPIVLSALFGALTAGLIYIATRRWFGRSAGTVAGTLLALSEYHILYSRSGLTDVTFLFFFLLALLCFDFAESRRSLLLASLAGVVTGLAWLTKYHGWLAGIVSAAALLSWCLLRDQRRIPGCLIRLSVAAVVAGLLYLPWYLHIEAQEGGYARLAEEHFRFLRPSGYVHHIYRHLRIQLFLDGWLGRASVAASFFALAVFSCRGRSCRITPVLLWGAAMAIAGVLLGTTILIGILALIGLVAIVRSPGRLSHWIAAAFFLVFSIMTPLYTPYARLLLPWYCAAAVLAAMGMSLVGEKLAFRTASGAGTGILLPAVLALAALVGVMVRPEVAGGRLFARSDGLRKAAEEIVPLVEDGRPVLVIGEPALVFYLKRLGVPAGHIDTPEEMAEDQAPGAALHLLGGIYSRRAPGLAIWMEKHPTAIRKVARIKVPVNDVRLLDDFRPRDAIVYRRGVQEEHDVLVYSVKLP